MASKVGHFHAVGDRPGLDQLVGTAGHQLCAIAVETDSMYRSLVTQHAPDLGELGIGQQPDAGRAIGRCGRQPGIVRTECQPMNRSVMAHQELNGLAAFDVDHSYCRSIRAARHKCQQCLIGANG